MIEIMVNKDPCKDCGAVFEREKKRGRPPTRCQECKDKLAIDQDIIVSELDPETLYKGPPEQLLGTPGKWPQGRESQCPICDRIFSCDRSCESHKKYPIGEPATCVDPSTIGMVAREKRGLPIWVRPAPPDTFKGRSHG